MQATIYLQLIDNLFNIELWKRNDFPSEKKNQINANCPASTKSGSTFWTFKVVVLGPSIPFPRDLGNG